MIPLTQEEIVQRMHFPGVLTVFPLDKGAGTQVISFDFSNTLSKSGITLTNWTTHYENLSLQIMAEYERVLDVSFVEMANDATDRHIELGLASSVSGAAGRGGYGWSSSGSNVDYNGWAATETLSDQSYLNIFAHELGHALGLQHSFAGSPAIPAAYEHEGYSIMSYTSDPGPSEVTGYAGGWKTLNTEELAILDVVALQANWGARLDHNTGDTTYGTGSTALTRTIVDGGGTDTLDLGDWTTNKMNAIIEMGRGGTSEVGRDTSGTPEFLRFAIDYNSDIENLIAPSATQVTVTGNDLANRIEATEVFGPGGFAAADHFEGLGGNDYLAGYTGNDSLFGGDGADSLYGGDGDDEVLGQEGADLIEGGSGNDVLGGDAMTMAELWQELSDAGFTVA